MRHTCRPPNRVPHARSIDSSEPAFRGEVHCQPVSTCPTRVYRSGQSPPPPDSSRIRHPQSATQSALAWATRPPCAMNARIHRFTETRVEIQNGQKDRKSQRRHNLWFHVNRKRRRRPRAPAPNVPDAAQSLREFVEQSFGAATMWESAGPSASTARRQSSLRYLGYACPRSHHTSPALRWQQYPHAA